MEYWFQEQQARIRHLPTTKRFLYHSIDWSGRCVGIVGARGTGKTTLMLQYLREHALGMEKALYISLDHPKFQKESLLEFGQRFVRRGGHTLLLDEVHKYPGWSVHIKTLYDSCPDLHIVFSGSSLLKLQEQDADLSRRAVIYLLHGLSFREFLNLSAQLDLPCLDLEAIFDDHVSLAAELTAHFKPLAHFDTYLHSGYYPFFLEGLDTYLLKLNEVIRQVLETDLPFVKRTDIGQIAKLKKLLLMLAANVPTKLNIQKLSSATEISRPSLYEYLNHLEAARLLNSVNHQGRGQRVLAKPEKMYLENTNLAYTLVERVNPGSIRETFFVNQVCNSAAHHPFLGENPLALATKGDFMINNRWTVEVGGRSKGLSQVSRIEESFVAADDVEVGSGRKIPLWLFGFLY